MSVPHAGGGRIETRSIDTMDATEPDGPWHPSDYRVVGLSGFSSDRASNGQPVLTGTPPVGEDEL